MTRDNDTLRATGEALLAELRDADSETRHEMLPALEAHITACRMAGAPVPPRLAEIEQAIHDEDVEDYFDNMPV